MYCLDILAGDFMILDLFCALSIVLIFVLFYVHLRAFVFPATVFSLSECSAIRWVNANLRFGLSPKFRVQINVYAQSFCSAKD